MRKFETSMENPYNQVPYHSAPFPQAHINRLASHAILNGLQPPDVSACRVLELGCNDGTHLIPMAMEYPESQFVGIDIAEMPITRANELAAELGLENVTFRAADVMQLSGQPGECDYLIAHGLYSWVPPAAQEKVMELCGRLLADRGIAYVSYNCYPAWHVREMTRNMVRIHTAGIIDPAEIRNRAIALLAGIYRSQGEREAYREAVRSEMDRIIAKDPVLCFHDDFAEHNNPVYVQEFVRRGKSVGLQFLAEAEPSDMQNGDFAPDTREALNSIEDTVEREQFYDFLTLRGFRRTLLCREDVILHRSADVEAMSRLHFAASIQGPSGMPDLTSFSSAEFTTNAGATITVNQPFVKVILYELSQAWPASLAFGELLAMGRRVAPLLSDEDAAAMLRELLLRMNLPGVMDMSPAPWKYPRSVSEMPAASRLARAQLRNGTRVTSLRHRAVDVDDDGAVALLRLLDGTRRTEDLMRDFTAALGRETNDQEMQQALARLLRLGLLAA